MKILLVRRIILAGGLLLQLSTLCFQSRGATGDVDLSFDPGSGVNGQVSALAMQPDGKVIIGGKFSTVQGLAREDVARLNANGSLDTMFDPGLGIDQSADPTIKSIVVQPDGKLLIGSVDRITMPGTNHPGIYRLNPDGTRDGSFNFDSTVHVGSIALQSDSNVLIATGIRWGGVDQVVRLHANGSRDTNFNANVSGTPGSSASGVDCLVVQPDGKILAGGQSVYTSSDPYEFSDFYSHLLNRLNANGSRDNSFEQLVGEELDSTSLHALALQPDGKVLVGGDFTIVKGATRHGIVRLTANGTLDATFNPGTGAAGILPNTSSGVPAVHAIVLQGDGKMLIAGNFTHFNGINRNGVARLNPDGSLDTSFDPGTGANGRVFSEIMQSEGKVLLGGEFTSFNGEARAAVVRLLNDPILAPRLNITRANPFVVLSRPASAAGYRLEESTNVALANSWSLVPQSTVTNADQISVTVPVDPVGRFFRLKSQ